MFNCRVCANTPFGSMFGYEDDDNRNVDNPSKRVKRDSSNYQLSDDNSLQSDIVGKYATDEDRKRFRLRTPEEVAAKVKAWECYLHARVKDIWENSPFVQEILNKVAQNIDKNSDPVLPDASECVFWHGKVDSETGIPIVHVVKPGKTTASDISVTRVLVFFYADDDSFQELEQKTDEVFNMICDEPLCINLTHISLD